jgi:sporadic carbohydrate cluster protein (TIGR04323 family)
MSTPAPSNRRGFRGYIAARETGGRSAPQAIQQLVIRDYCSKNSMAFLLSATEYRMAGCAMVLDGILHDEIDLIEGIVMYSIFLMPQSRTKRMQLYTRLFTSGAELHTAVEGIAIRHWGDAMKVEDLFLVWDIQSAQQKADYDYLTQWDKTHATAA